MASPPIGHGQAQRTEKLSSSSSYKPHLWLSLLCIALGSPACRYRQDCDSLHLCTVCRAGVAAALRSAADILMLAPPPGEAGEDYLGDHPRYQQLKYLSRGLFGYVVLAMDKTKGSLVGWQVSASESCCITLEVSVRGISYLILIGVQVAVKFIERTLDKLTRNVEREIINHSSLSHPHIVHFVECFLTARHLAIVMEYCAGGNMWQYVAAKYVAVLCVRYHILRQCLEVKLRSSHMSRKLLFWYQQRGRSPWHFHLLAIGQDTHVAQ